MFIIAFVRKSNLLSWVDWQPFSKMFAFREIWLVTHLNHFYIQLSFVRINNFASNNPRAKLSNFSQSSQDNKDVEFNSLSKDTNYIRSSWKMWKLEENYKSEKSTCFPISQKFAFLATFRQYSFEMKRDTRNFELAE